MNCLYFERSPLFIVCSKLYFWKTVLLWTGYKKNLFASLGGKVKLRILNHKLNFLNKQDLFKPNFSYIGRVQYFLHAFALDCIRFFYFKKEFIVLFIDACASLKKKTEHTLILTFLWGRCSTPKPPRLDGARGCFPINY